MAFQIFVGNIIEQQVDAIVNTTNERMIPGGGVDLHIHWAAGPKMDAAVKALGKCAVGEAKITPGFDLPAKYVIHTVGPIWEYGLHHEPELLASCYRNCLKLAEENNCKSIAFPLISAGAFRFPRERALEIAEDVIREYLESHEMEVSLVLYDPEQLRLDRAFEDDLRAAIRRSMRENSNIYRESISSFPETLEKSISQEEDEIELTDENALEEDAEEDEEIAEFPDELPVELYKKLECAVPDAAPMPELSDRDAHELESRLKGSSQSFSDYLFELIDKKGISDTEFYKHANMSRQTFSKAHEKNYHPKKDSVILMAFSLKLTPEEADLLLRHAGYSLSDTVPLDIAARFFLERHIFDYLAFESAKVRVEQGIFKF